MTARIVVYSRTGVTLRLARRLSEETGMPVSEIRCRGQAGRLGWVRAVWGALRGRLPEIEVVPPIGAAEALVVGGPVWFGRLAPPLRRFMAAARRLPPVVGVVVTRGQPGSGYRIETDVAALITDGAIARAPELLLLQARAADGPRARRRIRAYADQLRARLARPAPANLPEPPRPRVIRRGGSG